MKSFLESTANFIFSKYNGKLNSCGFLFPNRRSLLFFKNYLKKIPEMQGWIPDMFTISDLMTRLSGLQPADPLELSFGVYRSYLKNVSDPESFDEFYPWGEMMLSDFDDIDKYLVNPEQIFTNIVELKEIDTVFDYLTEEQKALVRRFWQYFQDGKLSDHKVSFLRIWRVLYPVYRDFTSNLDKQGLGYEGMIYRKVAESLGTEDAPEIPWEKIEIIGFNALSKSENKLFDFLKNSAKADFYWDYDPEYTVDEKAEAGRFLRRNLKRYPADPDFDPGLISSGNRNAVKIYNLPSDVLQAKQLYYLIESLGPKVNELNNTAIILGDESLLPAVLTSLPDNVENLNITMGYPVSQTPVFGFLDSILRLQQNLKRKKNRQGFYYRDVLTILNHQYLQSFYKSQTKKRVDRIHRLNLIYLKAEEFAGDAVMSKIFRKIETAAEMMDYLLELTNSLLDTIPSDNPSFKLEKEYIYIIKTRLIKLFNLFHENPVVDSLESFIRLFRKILSAYNIPFQGEPLKGLQIMGILESRLLDFENVFVLSLNEGVMPASSSASSYVPANLRYAFEMPVREDKDAIYAYYFFRLLQKVQQLFLLYNSKTEGMMSGEPSRYIYQLRYLQKKEIELYTAAFHISGDEKYPIQIPKSKEVLQSLQKFLSQADDKYLSPSALASYMECSLKFYFTYAAGIREEDEASEEIDASGFGSLYHKTMELIYQECKSRELSGKEIDLLRKKENIRKHLDQAYRLEFLKQKDSEKPVKPEGKNIIVYEIIMKMVDQTLLIDRRSAPFVFLETEQAIDVFHEIPDLGRVHLGGKIDRVDRRKENLYILDYKTGKADLKFDSLEKLFDREEWKSNNLKGVFQTFMYSWLYHHKFPDVQHLTPGIYHTSELFSDDFNTALYDKSAKNYLVDYFPYHEEFQSRLTGLIREIFDPAMDFVQTEDEKRCEYCPYSGICHR